MMSSTGHAARPTVIGTERRTVSRGARQPPASAADGLPAAQPWQAAVDPHRAPQSAAVRIGGPGLAGELIRVPEPCGLVVLAQDRRRMGRRERRLARIMSGYRLATLLLNLRTEADAARAAIDAAALSRRLEVALHWSRAQDDLGRLGTGLFGVGTAAAAALHAAARHPAWVSAVVTGGGTSLAPAAALERVQAPTLLIVGGQDSELLQHNRNALRAMRCESRLEVVPGATHRFEEPGATEAVAHLAGSWFANHLPSQQH